MSELRIMGKVGDTKVIYDKNNEDEVEAARDQFETLLEKGFTAFKVDKDGGKGRKVTKFDPKEERYILVPKIVGG